MAFFSLANRLFKKRVPLNLMLSLTDRCTGNCGYCKIPQRKSTEMTTDQVRILLTQARSMGCSRLGIWGGEPLVRDDLGEIITHAKKLGLFVTVDTNGHLLPKRNEALIGVDHLNISLNGDREAHDAACGNGSFDKTMAAIEHAKGRYRFWTITVLTRANVGRLDWILDTARDKGFQTTFQALHHNESLGSNDDFYPDDSALREAARYLLTQKRLGAPIANSVKYLRHLIRWQDYRLTRATTGGPDCLAGQLYCNVDTDGSLYPCSLLIDGCDAPNAAREGLPRAWKKLAEAPCDKCLAACFTEYNLLYRLDFFTGINWMKALRT